MKRIIALGLTLLMISSLAWMENGEPIPSTPKAYRINIGSYKLLIVTPLDTKRSVLIGLKKPLQKNPDSYLAEGVVALAISRMAKLAGKENNNKTVRKFVKEMVQARALAVKTEASEPW